MIQFDKSSGKYYIAAEKNTNVDITWLYRYKLMFDHLCHQLAKLHKIGIVVANTEDIILSNNTILGYEPDELVSKEVSVLTPGKVKHVTRVKSYLQSRKRTVEGITRHVTAVNKFGKLVPIQIHMQYINDLEKEDHGIINCFCAIIKEEEGLKANVNPQIIIDMASNPIILANQKDVIEQINETTAKLTGYRQEELIDHDIDTILPDKYNDTYLKQKSGTTIPIQLSIKEDIASGQSIYYIYDASKKIEETKRKFKFISAICHEIKTPMCGIVGICTELNEKNPIKDIDMIKNTANYILTIMKDLLDISKIETGQFKLEYKRFNLFEAVNNTIDNLHGLLLSKRQTIDVDCPAEVLMIGDQLRVEQILMNILSNAIKNDDNEGNTISIKALGDKDNVRILIKDNGRGMSREFIDKHLFTPFEYRESHINGGLVSSGLGMFIVKTIIDAMRGSIDIDSIENVGTKVYITIPTVDATTPKSKDKKVLTMPTDASQVVIIDDNNINCVLNQRVVSKYFQWTMKPISFINPLDAITYILTNIDNIKLVLVDHQMPELNGCEVAKQLKDNNFQGDIVAVTAADNYECQYVDATILKPISIKAFDNLFNASTNQ